jgi:hypothetical protein
MMMMMMMTRMKKSLVLVLAMLFALSNNWVAAQDALVRDVVTVYACKGLHSSLCCIYILGAVCGPNNNVVLVISFLLHSLSLSLSLVPFPSSGCPIFFYVPCFIIY